MKWVKLSEAVPRDYIPTSITPYVYMLRVIDVTSISSRTGRSANKEYIVRVYYYPDGTYGVISFYGRINGHLSMSWKGSYQIERYAISHANDVIDGKLHDPNKNYEVAELQTDDFNRARGVPGNSVRRQVDRSDVQVPYDPPIREEGEVGSSKKSHILEVEKDISNDDLDNIQDFNDLIDVMKSVDLDTLDYYERYPYIEKLIHNLLNGEFRNKVLELPKGFFDRIRMPPEDREIVEKHFGLNEKEIEVNEGDEEFPVPSLKDLISNKNRTYKFSIAPSIKENWYEKIGDKISNELSGYFKYPVDSDEEGNVFYDIWWKGLGSSLKISNHNMPIELFRDHFPKIEMAAQSKAEDAYKEVIKSYVGG